MSELNAGDVLAMTRNNDFLEGNGILVLLFFIMMLGGGIGGWGNWGNNSSYQNSLTRAELYDGLNAQNTFSEFRSLQNQVSDGFAANTLAMTNGFSGVQYGMSNGFNGIQSAIADTRYAMQNCCCELKTAVHSEGEQTRALIQSNTIQELRDRLADKDRELLTTGLVTAQTIQTNNLENFIRQITNGCGCSA